MRKRLGLSSLERLSFHQARSLHQARKGAAYDKSAEEAAGDSANALIMQFVEGHLEDPNNLYQQTKPLRFGEDLDGVDVK